MLPLIPRQDGDEIIIPTDNEGVSTFKAFLTALMQNEYFWTVVVILILFGLAGYAWKNYPVVRYATFFIGGIVASSYAVFAIFK